MFPIYVCTEVFSIPMVPTMGNLFAISSWYLTNELILLNVMEEIHLNSKTSAVAWGHFYYNIWFYKENKILWWTKAITRVRLVHNL